MNGFFFELSIVMIIALFFSILFHKLKQPLIVGYIFTGIVAGPLFFDVLSSAEGYEAFSHIGVALLLFIVGLHLNLKLIKEVGNVAIIAGVGQILMTSLLGFLIAYLFQISLFSSFLIGIALSFSSTIVIVKLLSDKHEIEQVHGKIAMGILIIQDLVAVIMLMVIATVGSNSDEILIISLAKVFSFGILGLIGVLIFSKYVLNGILDWIATSQEFLFIFVISWCMGVASLFASLGFSVEIGALIAGVALASSPYQFEISSRIKPLRDFFIVMFFVLLGSQMIQVSQIDDITPYQEGVGVVETVSVFVHNIGIKFMYLINNFSQILIPALVLSLFVLLVKPLIIFVQLNLLGFHSRVGFLTSISLAQISEFSLIMILIAQKASLVSPQEVSMLTLVGIITILVSTYFIMHSSKMYQSIHKILKKLEIKNPKRDIEKNIQKDLQILVFGYDRIGFSLLKTIEKLNKKYLVIDYSPVVLKKLEKKHIECIYGDATDNDFVQEFNLEAAEMFISTIPVMEANMGLLKQFKKRNSKAIVILTANQIDQALELYKEGADYVILPHFLGGDYVSTLIEKYDGKFQDFLSEKVKHIGQLKERKTHGTDHPRHN